MAQVIKRAFISSLVPFIPSGRPRISLPSSLKERGNTLITFLLFRFKLSSQSCNALFISKSVTSPSALEMIPMPLLTSPRKVTPPIETKARLIFIPEFFSAMEIAFLSEDTASEILMTYPCRMPFVSLSPTPTTLGFFSPFRNSPTTTLVVVDPMSTPIEIFLIILILCYLHSTTMCHSFQMKHSVDN